MRKSSEPSETRGRPGPKRPLKPFNSCSLLTSFWTFLPLHAEGRIGEHVVELLVRMAVIGERITGDDVPNILPLDQHVRLADGVGKVVQLLAEHGQAGLRIVLGEIFVGDGEHTARSRRRIVNRAHDAGLGEHIVILDEEQMHHEADDFAGREVLPGGVVRGFCEFADQLLEDQPHLHVGDFVGMQVEAREFLGDEIEQLGFGEPIDLLGEIEALEDVFNFRRERPDISVEIGGYIVLIAHEAAHDRALRCCRSRRPPCVERTDRD